MKIRKAILCLMAGAVLSAPVAQMAQVADAATYKGYVDGSFFLNEDSLKSESPKIGVGSHTLKLGFKSSTENANYFKICPSKDCTVNIEAWGFSNDFNKNHSYQDEVSLSVFDSNLDLKDIDVNGKESLSNSLSFYSKSGRKYGLAQYPRNKFETSGSLSFRAKAGRTYYLQVDKSAAWDSDNNHGKVKVKISLK